MKKRIIKSLSLFLSLAVIALTMSGCHILKQKTKTITDYKNITRKKTTYEFVPDEDSGSGTTYYYKSKTNTDKNTSSKSSNASTAASSKEAEETVFGTKYYVSNNGSDNNDGLSPQTAWKTISKVNSVPLLDDDSILFERGSEFRGETVQCAPGVSYGAYGEGNNPILNGSAKNYSEKDLWIATENSNVYKYNVPFSGLVDVGNLVFNDGEAYAVRMRNGISELKTDLSYYYDIKPNQDSEYYIYLRSDKGNPAERFKSIEVITNMHLMRGQQNNKIENITFKYANYGFTTSNATVYEVNNIVVDNCKFEWIGGCICGTDDNLRLGNAIEFWGSCSRVSIQNSEFSQIFDTAITTQFTSKAVVDGVYIYNNKIDKCHWGMEFWLQGEGSSMNDVVVEGNTVTNTGMGWSANQRWASLLIHSAAISDLGYMNFDRTNIVIKNNVFKLSAGMLLKLSGTNWSPEISGNTYIQSNNGAFGYIFKTNYSFNESFKNHALKKIDKTAKASFSEEQ